MFPMTITISNPAQLNAVMAALNVAGIESPKTSPCAGHAVETAKQTAKTEVKDEPKAEAQAAATTETAQATETADAPTYQATADAVTKLARTKGRDAAVAVLKEVNAAKLPDVDPSNFGKVIALVEAALGA